MSEPQLDPRTPRLSDFQVGGRPNEVVGIKVAQRSDISLFLIAARNARRDECKRKLKVAYDLDAPVTTKIAHASGMSLAWHGPAGWLAVANDRPDFESGLKAALGNSASIVDLSDARIVLRITGAMTRAVLAKGLSIDLHPRVFQPGDTAMTLLDHVAIQIWQIDELPTFELAIPRASARDVFYWLVVSADEFGLAIGE